MQKTIKNKIISALKIIGFNLLLLVVLLSALEGLWLYLLSHPDLARKIPGAITENIRKQYMNNDRNIIQLMPECSTYHPDYYYLLKPGSCIFSGPNFTTWINVNSRGLRDDEDSLRSPEIIVLGDSYAMGWGVEQDESFPELLEKNTGMKTLNAGISSFGTVRQARLLSRLDTSSLKYLIVQYGPGDGLENIFFSINGNDLPIQSRANYLKERAAYERRQEYYFGKHLNIFVRNLFTEQDAYNPNQIINDPEEVSLQEAACFLNALLSTTQNLDGVNIIVLELNENEEIDGVFANALEQLKRLPEYPDFINNMTVVKTLDIIEREDYYFFDDHLSADGHKKIADALTKVITSSQAYTSVRP